MLTSINLKKTRKKHMKTVTKSETNREVTGLNPALQIIALNVNGTKYSN